MRKNIKKVIAVSMSSLLAAGLIAGNVEYASHTFEMTHRVVAAAAIDAQKTSRENVKTSASGGLESDSEISKQETVYVTLDANGGTKDVVVSDWLKNSGTNGSLKDVSGLTDIENVKGEETFSQNGNKVTWQTSDQDIYYQGKTDQKLPVGVEMTYKLDGREVSPQDIMGKSGKLEINIKYTNTAAKTVTVAGKEVEIYVPFMMVTGMILPVETYKNITIDNGTIVSEGDNDFVVGFGMPGLAESLDLDNLDFGDDMNIDSSKIKDKITDTVKITADVTDFEMKSIYTVATNQVFNELDFDDIEDIDELNDKMDELRDSSRQLVDGSSDLQEGTQKLKDSFEKYADGIDTVHDGVSELKDGSGDLRDGVNTYTKGADKLLTGVGTYVKGAKQLSQGIQAYTAGTGQLVAAVSQLRTATKDLPTQYGALGDGVDTFVSSVNTLLSKENMDTMSAGTASLKKGIGELDDGLSAAQSGVAAINAAADKLKKTAELDACVAGLNSMIEQYTAAAQQYAADGDENSAKQYKDMAAALTGAVTYIQGGEQVAAGIDAATNGKADGAADNNGAGDLAVALATMEKATSKNSKDTNLYTGAASLEKAAGTMSDYASQLRDSSGKLTSANAAMRTGVNQLEGSIQQMDTAAGTLVDNNEALNSGAKSLIENSSEITSNSRKLTKSSGSLRSGAKKLSKGVNSLFDGMQKLVKSTGDVSDGISDLNDGAVDLKDGMSRFDRDGIIKVTDTIAELLDTTDEFNERISKISTASNEYISFSGAAKGMKGSVKFIMATEEVEAED